MTRILRLQRGEVWARSNDGQRPVEIETPVAVLAPRSAEVSVRLVSSASRGRTCTQPTVADVRPVTDWSHPLLNP